MDTERERERKTRSRHRRRERERWVREKGGRGRERGVREKGGRGRERGVREQVIFNRVYKWDQRAANLVYVELVEGVLQDLVVVDVLVLVLGVEVHLKTSHRNRKHDNQQSPGSLSLKEFTIACPSGDLESL